MMFTNRFRLGLVPGDVVDVTLTDGCRMTDARVWRSGWWLMVGECIRLVSLRGTWGPSIRFVSHGKRAVMPL